MALYSKKLTRANSTEIYVYEPDNVYAQSGSAMAVGKNGDGIKKFFYLRLPSDRPVSGTVSSAKIKLAQSDYGFPDSVLVMVSPVTGTGWTTATKWLGKPAHEASVHADLTISTEPTQGSNDYETGYHPAKYGIKRYQRANTSDPWELLYNMSLTKDEYDSRYLAYGNSVDNYTSSGGMYIWFHLYSTAAYNDIIVKYREWDITAVYQYMIANNLDAIVFWFDTTGASGTHKYFYAPNATNTNLLPLLTVEYSTAYDPTAPTLNAVVSPITTDEYTFGWSGTDALCYYEMQLSDDDGVTWGDTLTTAAVNASSLLVDVRAYFGLSDTQYMNNATVRARVRAKLVSGGTNYYSEYSTSAAFTVLYEVEPIPAPPELLAPTTITTDIFTFAWNDAEDLALVNTPDELYYEMRISTDGGTTWGAAVTTAQGDPQYSVDLRAYLGLQAAQYYYNTNVKIKVRTKTPIYPAVTGEPFYSEYVVSEAYIISFPSAPPVPVYSDESNVIDMYWETPESDMGYPKIKFLTDMYFIGWGTKSDGTAGGQVKVFIYYNKNGTVKTKVKIITLPTTRKEYHIRPMVMGRIFKFRFENVEGSAIHIIPIDLDFEPMGD
jgi:hypothetical protein